MRKVNQLTLIRMGLTLAAVLMACSVVASQDVRTNYTPGTDFAKYKTYKWVEVGRI